jgi:8-oxo-dGTP pyrophosphatase MutT (NUDIX family)
MESRSAKASVAANKLVCFGGKRELGENPNLCIRRECKEEMNFVPKSMTRSTDLFVDGKVGVLALQTWFLLKQTNNC